MSSDSVTIVGILGLSLGLLLLAGVHCDNQGEAAYMLGVQSDRLAPAGLLVGVHIDNAIEHSSTMNIVSGLTTCNMNYGRADLFDLKCCATKPENLNLLYDPSADSLCPVLKKRRCRGGSRRHLFTPSLNNNWKDNLTHKPMSQRGINRKNLVTIRPVASILRGELLKLHMVNTRSVNNKPEVIVEELTDKNIDAYALTETWLKPGDEASRCALEPEGYKLLDQPRSDRTGGGTGLIVRQSYKCKKSAGGENKSFEYSTYSITQANKKVLDICVIYRPPYSPAHPVTTNVFFQEFPAYLSELLLTKHPLLVLGDLNIHVDVINDPDALKLQEVLDSFDLGQLVTFPTHLSGHTLDLCIIRQIDKGLVELLSQGQFVSDHCVVEMSVNMNFQKKSQIEVSSRRIKAIDLSAFTSDLDRVCSQLHDVDDVSLLATQYDKELSTLLDNHAPIKRRLITLRPNSDWFDQACKEAKKVKRRAEIAFKQHSTDETEKHLKDSQKDYNKQLRQSKHSYYNTKIAACAGNQRELYKVVNSLVKRQAAETPLCDSKQDLVNGFADYFVSKVANIRKEIDSCLFEEPILAPFDPPCRPMHEFAELSFVDTKKLVLKSPTKSCSMDPLPTQLLKETLDTSLPLITKLVNLSLSSGVFPTNWKHALVTPLLKKAGLELTYKNYRPVSNLSYISKLVERAVVNQLNDHLKLNCPMPDRQSAYRVGYSTETSALRLKSDILQDMDNQRVVVLVQIDLSAAFDTIDHTLLLDELNRKYGIEGTVLSWFKSYLSGRTMSVFLDGESSCSKKLDIGVPQGSCLGPILFTLYAASLFKLTAKSDCDTYGFADDHTLKLSFSPGECDSENVSLNAIRSCLENIGNWMLKYKLKMNQEKTEVILIGSRQQLIKVRSSTLDIGGVSLKYLDSVRHLGAYLDKNLTMSDHVQQKCRKASSQLYVLRRIRPALDRRATEMLVHSMVTSHIDYCNSLLYGMPDNTLRPLQYVLNMCARLVFCLGKFEHITVHLKDLHWLPVRQRVNFKIVLLTFKCVKNYPSPNYLRELISMSTPTTYDLRNNRELSIEPCKFNCSTFGGRAFGHAASNLWNSLPLKLRECDNVQTFKTLLKTHYFREAFV